MHTLPYSSSSASSPSSGSDTSLTCVRAPPPPDSRICVIALDTSVASHFLDGALLTSEKMDELLTYKTALQCAGGRRYMEDYFAIKLRMNDFGSKPTSLYLMVTGEKRLPSLCMNNSGELSKTNAHKYTCAQAPTCTRAHMCGIYQPVQES